MTELFPLDDTDISAKYKEEQYLHEAERYRLLRAAMVSRKNGNCDGTDDRGKLWDRIIRWALRKQPSSHTTGEIMTSPVPSGKINKNLP
jgi:hypothetical protein